MALFQGEDLVDITTPDGRSMKVPASIAQSMQLQQQAPAGGVPQANPMPTTQAPTAADIPPESVTGGALPGSANPYEAPPSTDVVRNGPDYVVPDPTITAVKTAPARAKQVQANTAAAKKQAAAAASPTGQRAGADQQTQGALGNEKQATLDAANTDAAAQDLLAQASEQHNQKIDGLFEQRAAQARAAADEEAKKNDDIVSLRKKIAGTKIDRKADHPILGALSIALAGLGSAMQNRYTNQPISTTALDTFWKAIDRKVSAQMGDLELMKDQYGMTKDELGSLEKMHDRKLEMYNGMIAGEADKAKRHLEEIVAKSASDKTKANAKILMSQIDERAAQAHTEAVRWGLEYDQRDQHQKQQLGLGYAQLGESKRSNMAQEELKREDMYLDAQKYLGGLKSSGDTEAYKAGLKQTEEVGKRGVRDMNGDLLLMPEAKAKMQQAQQLEDQAAQAEAVGKADPLTFGVKGGAQRVQMLRERAAQLRGEANTTGAVLAHNDTEAVTVSNMISSGQSTVQLIDGIKELADQAGRGLISRDQAQSKLQAMFNELGPNLKEAWQLGAWDKGSANLVANIIGQDPSSDWNVGGIGSIVTQKMYEDPNSFKGRLDSVAEGLERAAKNRLVGLGAKFGKDEKVLQRQPGLDTNTPQAKAAGAITGATPSKQAENTAASAGVPAKIVDTLTIGKGPLSSREDQAQQIDNSSVIAPGGFPTGLSQAQYKGFNTLLDAYKSGNKPVDGQTPEAQMLASVSNAAVKQPDLAVALLKNLQQFAPDVYVKARKLVPQGGDVDNAMSYQETSRIGSAVNDTPTLANMVINTLDKDGMVTDAEDFRELGRRASAGDPDAKKAILQIVQGVGSRNVQRNLGDPTPSIVKGNR